VFSKFETLFYLPLNPYPYLGPFCFLAQPEGLLVALRFPLVAAA
jgi:hypothetical protein